MKQGHNKKSADLGESIEGIMATAKKHYSGVQTFRQSIVKEMNELSKEIEKREKEMTHEFVEVQRKNVTYSEKTFIEKYTGKGQEELMDRMNEEYGKRVKEIAETMELGMKMNETKFEESIASQNEIERILKQWNVNMEEKKKFCYQIEELKKELKEIKQKKCETTNVEYKENLRSILLGIEECLKLNDPKMSITYLKTINVQMFSVRKSFK